MKNIKSIKLIGFMLIISSLIFSCVPVRQFEDIKSQKNECEAERILLKKGNETLNTENNELIVLVDQLKRDNTTLVSDTAVKGSAYRTLIYQYDKINELYKHLLTNQERLRQDADADSEKSLSLLQKTRDKLQQKEDALKELEAKLNKDRHDLDITRLELEQKNSKVKELKALINDQEASMKALRNKVSAALVNFEGDGLTVELKNGKVYVSLEEKLLFKSGKWSVDAKGVQAIQKLAESLENNKDIDIQIEGHTDELAYNGNGNIEDNWDLSVKRATSIVKILLKNSKIDASQLTASGRSSHLPISNNTTADGRARNRRTEIILTPKLNELYEIMEK